MTANLRVPKNITILPLPAKAPEMNPVENIWAAVTYGGKGGMDWANLKPGDYTYIVFLHEFGHALGLKHSFESGGVAGAIPKEFDSLEYTVMSLQSDWLIH